MLDSLLASVDLYCERTGPGLWAEPVNAVSNLTFIAAGLWGVYEVRLRRTGRLAEMLAWWVVAIGIGSTLFHTFANQMTIWADILPIAGFTLVYTVFNLRRFLGFGWGKVTIIFVAFYAVAAAATWLVPEWLRLASNGSTGYLPPFLALLFFGALVTANGKPAGWYNLAAATIFAVSVTFRTIDARVCEALPLGTHFLWHVLNGLMLGILLAAVAKCGAPGRTPAKEKPPKLGAPAALSMKARSRLWIRRPGRAARIAKCRRS
jgi:hypothetical protein